MTGLMAQTSGGSRHRPWELLPTSITAPHGGLVAIASAEAGLRLCRWGGDLPARLARRLG